MKLIPTLALALLVAASLASTAQALPPTDGVPPPPTAAYCDKPQSNPQWQLYCGVHSATLVLAKAIDNASIFDPAFKTVRDMLVAADDATYCLNNPQDPVCPRIEIVRP